MKKKKPLQKHLTKETDNTTNKTIILSKVVPFSLNCSRITTSAASPPNFCYHILVCYKTTSLDSLVNIKISENKLVLASLEFIKMIASWASVISAFGLVLVNMIKMNLGLLIVPLDTLEHNAIIENIAISSSQKVQWY